MADGFRGEALWVYVIACVNEGGGELWHLCKLLRNFCGSPSHRRDVFTAQLLYETCAKRPATVADPVVPKKTA